MTTIARTSRGTNRALLACGLLAGPFYLAVGISQGLARPGFDFSRHALSVLANGKLGWVQTVNFAATGILVVAAALGIWRVLRPHARAMALFLACYGVCIAAAAVFPADPVDGFPPGTPVGPPTSITTTGLVHFIAGGLGFLCLAISCFCSVPALRRTGDATLGRISLASGVVVFAGFFGGIFLPVGAWGIWGIWAAVVAGWAWLACVAYRLLRRS